MAVRAHGDGGHQEAGDGRRRGGGGCGGADGGERGRLVVPPQVGLVTPVVVRASVRANLLGIRLLRLEADIAVAPVRGGAALPHGDLRTARELLAHASRTLESSSRVATP